VFREIVGPLRHERLVSARPVSSSEA
jgi:hypothetical protein